MEEIARSPEIKATSRGFKRVGFNRGWQLHGR